MESNFTADEALTQVESAREQMARRVTTPLWYHPCLGAVEGLLVFSVGVPVANWGTPARLAASVVSLLAIGVLVRLYRRMTGVWIGPRQAGPRARKPWLAIVVVMVACLVASLVAQTLPHPLVWAGGSALIAWASVVSLGRRFDEALGADIRAGEADVMMSA